MPTPIVQRPQPRDAAWSAADMTASGRWLLELTDADRAELDAALRAAGDHPDITRLTRDRFPLPRFGTRLAAVRHELEAGTGVTVIRGLPVDRYTDEEAARIYWGIGAWLGDSVPQNPRGELLGHVVDRGRDVKQDPNARVYETNAYLPFHSDPGDVVGLLCLRTAKAGGLSCIASAMAIHDHLALHEPAVLAALYEPFYYDRRGEQLPGELPYHAIPVFSPNGDGIFSYYLREYIEGAQRFEHTPRLTAAQVAAMDRLDALAKDDRFRLDMAFAPGDIQFLNNHVVLHSRTGFIDYDEPARRRHLLRLWLNTPGLSGRGLPPAYARFLDLVMNWRKPPTASAVAAEVA